ncbi:MFS transporter [Bordetella avium]|uniref:MFS transporter n=2 Tax=Bordetella avium TaxID=521 RepID=UPI000E0A48E3|nr:MFS transporter [Bordetella avium]AZY50326.1 MFS transporter [Bordetella avium]RIQ15506.1 MFS transporter [Bordetella avium]RIQ38383.1 MFS transporter [Bordetella avium]RIQ42923.1 MFS transporter [Bordetella avium]RIQ44146.1 MFS transporter [Bordetella avium]
MSAAYSEGRAIVLLALAAFVSASAFRICDPMLPQLAGEFSTTTGQAAHAVTAFAVAYGFLQMFFGPLGDRYGKYRVVCLATFACALGSAGAALAGTLDMLVLCRILSGAAGAGIVPLSMAWIGDNVPYERRQATLARFLTGTILGMAAGSLAGGIFADTIGWRSAFMVLVLGYVIVGLLLWAEVRRQTALGLGGAVRSVNQGFVAQARRVWSTPWARVVLATVFVEGLLVFGALAFVPAYLHTRFDLSLTMAGALVALYAVGGIAYTFVAAAVLRRMGERGLVMAGGLVLCLAFLLYLLGPAWGWSVLASMMAGFGYYLLHATLQTNATQMVPEARGTAVAWFASCLFMGQAVGVALAGVTIDELGAQTLFAATALGLPLLGLAFGQALRRRAQV